MAKRWRASSRGTQRRRGVIGSGRVFREVRRLRQVALRRTQRDFGLYRLHVCPFRPQGGISCCLSELDPLAKVRDVSTGLDMTREGRLFGEVETLNNLPTGSLKSAWACTEQDIARHRNGLARAETDLDHKATVTMPCRPSLLVVKLDMLEAYYPRQPGRYLPLLYWALLCLVLIRL